MVFLQHMIVNLPSIVELAMTLVGNLIKLGGIGFFKNEEII